MKPWPFIAAATAVLAACATPDDWPINPSAPGVIVAQDTDTVQHGVKDENIQLGTGTWDDGTPADPSNLAVWASPYAVRGIDTLSVFIHSASPMVRVQIFRLGWYGGTGGRMVLDVPHVAATRQLACTPAFPGPVECPWSRTIGIQIDPSWAGGLYLLRVRNDSNQVYSYPFVVRSRQPHRFTAVINQFTWQAYNNFGGSSLYTIDPGTGFTVPVVSFERPYGQQAGMMTTGGPEAGGSNDLPIIRWLESRGVDLGYMSDMGLADSATPLPPVHALLFVGHDEYWTWTEYGRVEALRDAGIHLAFMAGNNVYWNIRLSSGTTTGRPFHRMTSYKLQPDRDAPSPEQTTTKFRNPPLNKPENGLVGVEYSSLLPDGASPPFFVPAESLRAIEGIGFLSAAGLHTGDTLAIGAGNEGDQIIKNGFSPANLQVLLKSQLQPATGPLRVYHSTFYIAPSGAGVWATASNQWGAYLDGSRAPSDPHVQGLTTAILQWMDAH